jgi:hypothetical protein
MGPFLFQIRSLVEIEQPMIIDLDDSRQYRTDHEQSAQMVSAQGSKDRLVASNLGGWAIIVSVIAIGAVVGRVNP